MSRTPDHACRQESAEHNYRPDGSPMYKQSKKIDYLDTNQIRHKLPQKAIPDL
jgi:hypothetical protein